MLEVGAAMIDARMNCVVYEEMKNKEELSYWFDYKQKKFLHNIDTLYYSVKLGENFTKNSKDLEVIQFRKYFEDLDPNTPDFCVPLDFKQDMQLNYIPMSFAGFYDICIEYPEYFDIFMASRVPSTVADGDESVTSEMIVQIRSCLLWELGAVKAYEYSMEAVRAVCAYFHFTIDEVKENRIDYCWHTNYLQNPETYFRIDNMVDMAVTRLGRSNKERGNSILYHYSMRPGETYENDYIALGKRGDKCFLRIYMKSKEVVQMGYKPWFFKTWLFHGLINRYDFYCYEETYKTGQWQRLDLSRLQFYLEYGRNDVYKKEIRELLSQDNPSYDRAAELADLLTPKVHLIMNIEYQTTRRHSKNYILLPLKDNSKYGVEKRIYSYFDNHALITEYLTHDMFRLIDVKSDTNRARCDYNGFWKALRNTKLVDVAIPPKDLKLHRKYSREINADMVRKRAMNGVMTHSLYYNGVNTQHPVADVIDFLVRMNDNDIQELKLYKAKKAKLLNNRELGNVRLYNGPNLFERYKVINMETGEVVGSDMESIGRFFFGDGAGYDTGGSI